MTKKRGTLPPDSLVKCVDSFGTHLQTHTNLPSYGTDLALLKLQRTIFLYTVAYKISFPLNTQEGIQPYPIRQGSPQASCPIRSSVLHGSSASAQPHHVLSPQPKRSMNLRSSHYLTMFELHRRGSGCCDVQQT
jgi:hypothetical protein